MSQEREFAGVDVAEAIKKACSRLKVSRDDLDITVLSTGSTGIFGLCKKVARIRVGLKSSQTDAPAAPSEDGATFNKAMTNGAPDEGQDVDLEAKALAVEDVGDQTPLPPAAVVVTLDDAMAERIRTDLLGLLQRIKGEAEVLVAQEEGTVVARIKSDDSEHIIGPEGETIDALQYILRKIVSKTCGSKVAVILDVADFRNNRRKELETLALKLAEEVKETGKTRTMPALSPEDRRAVHLVLHADTGVRSRSVGDGLHKKVLIYLPNKGGGKPPAKKRRRSTPQSKTTPVDEQG